MVELTMDFLWIIVPTLSIFTVLADWTNVCAVCLVLLLVLCIVLERFWISTSSYSKDGSKPVASLRGNLSSYRVSMMLVTCLCILAVDFKIFPRRYGKTERYGTGLMDLGVGSFVVANALVSRQARKAPSTKHGAAFQSVSPLILLGFARVLLTRAVDYQVHVGEYGVHWNFFFTLAAVSLLTNFINIDPQYSGILGALILLVYQLVLKGGLNAYLLSNERDLDLVSLNKEGIFSLFGYWGMYLVGVGLGYQLFFAKNSTTHDTGKCQKKPLIGVWFCSIFFWLTTIFLDKHVENVSRRMCNLAYVTFVLAQNFQVLAILMLSNFIPERKLLSLEEAFDQNLLAAFLLANVLTGLINVYVDTLFVSSTAAFSILIGYAVALSFFLGCAKFFNVKFKFW
ncbi:uncharacterized protein At4g17910 isoform X2 [Amborella trichopoda]|nr:uncharacterized protein At4g17910 isoform X2 [Amborella trichopoda]|eukprot:XP_020520071.1 uncharacterized protein At4g17910 isoform X2 [Amborella trichopoda]